MPRPVEVTDLFPGGAFWHVLGPPALWKAEGKDCMLKPSQGNLASWLELVSKQKLLKIVIDNVSARTMGSICSPTNNITFF